VNLPVAGMMHQPEIREVVCPAVTLGPHVVDVDLFPIVQSLVADRTAPVLPPGEWPRATGRAGGALPPWAPVVLEGRVIGRIRGGHESMADDGGPGAFPEGPMPFLILQHPAVLTTAEPAPILLGAPPARFSRVPPLHGALSASIQEAVQGRAYLLGHSDAAIVTPASEDGIHLVTQRHGGGAPVLAPEPFELPLDLPDGVGPWVDQQLVATA
jgi:hypothetical protein